MVSPQLGLGLLLLVSFGMVLAAETNPYPADIAATPGSSDSTLLDGPLMIALLLALFAAAGYWLNRLNRRNRSGADLSTAPLGEREKALLLLDRLAAESHDGVWARSSEGQILYANPALHQMLGLSPGHPQDLLQQWRNSIHPQDLPLFEQGERALQEHGQRKIHYRLSLPGQPLRWVEDRASLIRQDASVSRTMGIMADITERKQHEQQITSLSRYLGIISLTNQAVIRCHSPGELYAELCEIMTHQGGFAACWLTRESSELEVNTAPSSTLIAANTGLPPDLRQQLDQAGLTAHLSEGGVQSLQRLKENEPGNEVPPLLTRYFPAGSHLLCFPLHQEGKQVALLKLVAQAGDLVDDTALSMLNKLVEEVSFALDLYAREGLRQQAEAQWQLAAKVFENNREGVVITDAQCHILSVNRAFSQVTGYSAEEAVGLTPSLLASGQHDSAFYRKMWQTVGSQGYWQGEIWNRRRNGETYPELLTISAVSDKDGQVSHYIGVFSDITSRKTDQQRLEFLAHHDALTGLPNRALLRDRVEMAINNARRSGKLAALVFLDLDNFKSVNDSLGHQVGDQLLIALVERVSQCLRESDTLSRLGGDEFVAVITEIQEAEDAAVVARKILASVEAPILLAGQALNLAFSIGIAVFPEDGGDFDILLRNADTAMYHAKKAGKRTYRFFESDMNANAMEKLQLQSALFHAAERGELRLVYQPQVDIPTGRIVGAEALLRWQSPEFGNVPPAKFIPIAEESGFILAIGDWVLDEACRQAKAWRDAGLADIVMAVNISGLQFKRGNLVERVAALLKKHQLAANQLELEITESTMVQGDNQVLEAVIELKKLGVQLSIDDFGTGYSNLGYLRQFNADKLKVDQSFISMMEQGGDDEILVRTIIQMAANLKLKTIAEGVESEAQRLCLTAMGCNEIQGFLFSHPIPPENFAELLNQHTSYLH